MTRARISNRQFLFSSFIAEMKFFEIAEGKNVIITIDDKPTANMRRFFEGAIVPSIFYQQPKSGWENFRDAREALKLEFLGVATKTLDGKTAKVPLSTMTLSKKRFTAFIENILHWMEENGMEPPDAEAYKEWVASAPIAGEMYPPLLRLKRMYTLAHAKRRRRVVLKQSGSVAVSSDPDNVHNPSGINNAKRRKPHSK